MRVRQCTGCYVTICRYDLNAFHFNCCTCRSNRCPPPPPPNLYVPSLRVYTRLSRSKGRSLPRGPGILHRARVCADALQDRCGPHGRVGGRFDGRELVRSGFARDRSVGAKWIRIKGPQAAPGQGVKGHQPPQGGRSRCK